MEHVVTVFVVVMRPNAVLEISMIMEERAIVEDSLNPLKLHEVAGFQSLDVILARVSLLLQINRWDYSYCIIRLPGFCTIPNRLH
jgi:hypothetical protein